MARAPQSRQEQQPTDPQVDSTDSVGADASRTRFSTGGNIPPVALGPYVTHPTASELAYGPEPEQDAHDQRGGLSRFFGNAINAIGSVLGLRHDHDQTARNEQAEPSKDDPASAFFSQRDNAFHGTLNGAEESEKTTCNVTGLAMQLVTMGGSREVVNARTIELMREHGERRSAGELMDMQVEDLLMELFALRGDDYWKKASDEGKTPMWPGFYEWAKSMGVGWNQFAACLGHTALQYTGIVGGFKHHEKNEAGATPEHFLGTLKPELDKGATVMVSTRLCGNHLVVLAGVEPDGVRINDPYGMRLAPGAPGLSASGYLQNGRAVTAEAIAENRELATLRTRFNPTLRSAFDTGAKSAVPNWGENIFFTWDEVTAFQIGIWDNVLTKQPSSPNAEPERGGRERV